MEAGSGSRDKSHLRACEHHAFIKVSEEPARERKEAKLLPLGHEKMTEKKVSASKTMLQGRLAW